MIWTIAKKELRGYFHSALALIFLGGFIALTFVRFFWIENFFARGIADLRLLFESMPLFMIILVAGLAMRVWADERRAGTLELLLTLPITRLQLVLGKFVAGMLLITVALTLTLGLPVTVSSMGDLDTGPVLGGYLATLLLAAAYFAIGMALSAATSSTVLAMFGTAFVCGVPYGLGKLGVIGELLGTSERFESVARGVLDVRDLAYYGTIIVIGLALNVLLLDRMTWGRGPRTRPRRIGAAITVLLVAANAIAIHFWLSPIQRARIDLTENNSYSLSESTENILAGLDEQLLIRGYFSEKMHPLLVPLVPQLEDLLEEYRIIGGKVRVEIVDPTANDDAKREAKERFDIDPEPMQFETSDEHSLINGYFAIAVQYGDQHVVLSVGDLIQGRRRDENVEVTLRNPEYEITRAIKKAVTGFSSIESLFASLPGKVKVTAFVTPKTLPENWKDAPATIQKVIDKLTKIAGGKLEATTFEPTTEPQMVELFNKYGLRPFTEFPSNKYFYSHILLEVAGRRALVDPPQDFTDTALEAAVLDKLKRAAPGFTRVVAMWTPPPMPPMQGMPPQQMPPPQAFENLKRSLSGPYRIRDATLGVRIPDDVDVLVLCGPANLTPEEVENVDQFVMRGGALVVLAGRYRLAPSNSIAIEKVTTGLEAMFGTWGITLGDELVLDTKSDKFPITKDKDLGDGTRIRELHPTPYPFFLRFDDDGLSSHIITGGLSGSIVHFGVPVRADAKIGDDAHRVEVLMRSSPNSWLSASTQVVPDPQSDNLGFPRPQNLAPDKQGRQVLGVAITGGFTSITKKDPKAAPPTTGSGSDAKPRTLEHSPLDARVVVFGSSAFASDDLLGLARQMRSDLALSNVQLVHNAVDWALADTDLLAIRSHDSNARALTIEPDARGKWPYINLVIAFIGLGLVILFAFIRRRSVTPIVTAKGE